MSITNNNTASQPTIEQIHNAAFSQLKQEAQSVDLPPLPEPKFETSLNSTVVAAYYDSLQMRDYGQQRYRAALASHQEPDHINGVIEMVSQPAPDSNVIAHAPIATACRDSDVIAQPVPCNMGALCIGCSPMPEECDNPAVAQPVPDDVVRDAMRYRWMKAWDKLNGWTDAFIDKEMAIDAAIEQQKEQP